MKKTTSSLSTINTAFQGDFTALKLNQYLGYVSVLKDWQRSIVSRAQKVLVIVTVYSRFPWLPPSSLNC